MSLMLGVGIMGLLGEEPSATLKIGLAFGVFADFDYEVLFFKVLQN